MTSTSHQTRIADMEILPINAYYTHRERSAIVSRPGITETLIKITLENGLIGWGESTRCADSGGILSALKAMRPFVIGRDVFNDEAIHRDIWVAGGWHLQPMTANLSYAGIDMALWDLKGKIAGRPIHDLLGGPLRDEVDYYYYLPLTNEAELRTLCRDGVERGFNVFYIKVGLNEAEEETFLQLIREEIGPNRQIRIDANQAWSIPDAVRIINRWQELIGIDLIEAPVKIDDLTQMLDVRARTGASISINEGLWHEPDMHRIINQRPGDYLCFSSYWVGSARRFMSMAWLSHHKGWKIIKHTHGELGLAAFMGQHLLLAAPNTDVGHQHTAAWMKTDIITEKLPPATTPRWGRITKPGLGVEIDEAAVAAAHADFKANGPISIHDQES
ncbi:MAG: mandelate racemase/muconate lactonizing enzyme family protein [Rhizobiales bacterium]|nr:mandelate racemase/muconate lactonizing enzyme family protein [Hyphomicrobiales bacterium]NRB15422.1 mandelate racemase/muconate lactonizing enzyme family protein [Hyphomicrobiales bacterium]